jgi:CRP/FNR family transcriptional regulator, cyclic AMP receptor protein
MQTHRLPLGRHAIDKRALLRDHPIFGGLPADLIDLLGAKAGMRAVRRHATIFSKGDDGNGLYAVMAGTVKISSSSVDGREAMFNLIHSGEIFGEIALLDGRPRTADAAAMTDCELMMIDRRDFMPLVRAQPEVAMRLIELLCARLRSTSEQYEEIMFLDFPGRLAKTLLRLTDRISPSSSQQTLPITQREISNFLGKSRESTNKQLGIWARRGWVSLRRGRVVVLSPASLAAVAAAGVEPEDSAATAGDVPAARPRAAAVR